MTGNVWEWCSDWYDSNYYNNSPSSDPKGPSSGAGHVLRGDCWANDAGSRQVSSRFWNYQGDTSSGCGFRLAMDAK